MSEFTFKLVKPAKNKGGDRYSTVLGTYEWTVYFPQEISRPSGQPTNNIVIEIKKEN
jgi:hypothetical protein